MEKKTYPEIVRNLSFYRTVRWKDADPKTEVNFGHFRVCQILWPLVRNAFLFVEGHGSCAEISVTERYFSILTKASNQFLVQVPLPKGLHAALLDASMGPVEDFPKVHREQPLDVFPRILKDHTGKGYLVAHPTIVESLKLDARWSVGGVKFYSASNFTISDHGPTVVGSFSGNGINAPTQFLFQSTQVPENRVVSTLTSATARDLPELPYRGLEKIQAGELWGAYSAWRAYVV